MFEYFFDKYRTEIYKGNIRELKSIPKTQWVAFFAFIICAVAFFCTWWLRMPIAVFLLLGMIGSVILLAFLKNREFDKTCDARMEKYKQGKLQPLVDLLKDEKFSFYSAEKVDWLISSCNAKLQGEKNPFSGLVDSFSKWVFPAVSVLIGTLISPEHPEISIMVVGLLFASWAMVFFLKVAFSSILEYFACPHKEALLFLKSELEYIRLFLI